MQLLVERMRFPRAAVEKGVSLLEKGAAPAKANVVKNIKVEDSIFKLSLLEPNEVFI